MYLGELNMRLTTLAAFMVCLLFGAGCAAQDNYEIQVYGADTVDPGATMFELHSNFTLDGRKTFEQGAAPTNHAFHETLEITHGFTSWFETGFYVFSTIQPNLGWDYVGSHIRPRVRAPDAWHWPVGVSLSTEFGYVRPLFAADTWTWELRPIVDKKLGRWYLAFNPALEKSFRGPAQPHGWEFAPAFKFSYDVSKAVAFGLEYYGGLGPLSNFDPLSQQEHQVVPSFDFNFSPKWELNVGAGVGTTRSTDRFLLKVILGRRFDHLPFLPGKK